MKIRSIRNFEGGTNRVNLRTSRWSSGDFLVTEQFFNVNLDTCARKRNDDLKRRSTTSDKNFIARLNKQIR